MKFDTSKEGLLTFFKPYQAILMEHIWELNNEEKTGVTSGKAYEYLQDLPEKKSRASVINFLNDMVDEGVLTYDEESGKGGFHRVYFPTMNREEFGKHALKTITDKLREVFQQ